MKKEKKMEKDEQKCEKSIDEVLMQELRFGDIDEDNLKELVETVAGFYKGGLKSMRITPKETLADQDGLQASGGTSRSLQVDGVISSTQLSDLYHVIFRTSGLREIRFFPYGIIDGPDFFRVNINIDRVGRAGRL
jgi:hypothetical protein